MQRLRDLTKQQLVAHTPVEALAVPVPPRRHRLDECGLGFNCCDLPYRAWEAMLHQQ